MPNINHTQQLAQALLATPLREVIAEQKNRESLLLQPGMDYISEPDPATFSPNSRPVHQVPIAPDQATLRETLSIMANKYLGDPFVREESRRKAKTNAAYQAHVNHYPQLQAYLAFFDALTQLADDATPPDANVLSKGIATLQALAQDAEATHNGFREEMLANARLEEDHYTQKTFNMLEQLTQAAEKPTAFPQELFDRVQRMSMEDQQTVLTDLHQWLQQHQPMTEEDYATRRAINSRFVDMCDSHQTELLRYVADKAKAIAGDLGAIANSL